MIVILSKEPGQGGSYQIGTWEEPIFWVDMENRVKRTVDAYYSDKLITIKQCLAYTKDFKEDHIKTLENVEDALKNISGFATVGFDGIGDLRDIAHTKWCLKNKRKHAVNPGDWEEVNEVVRELLFPLINQCRVQGLHLVMTAQFKDDYTTNSKGESNKSGRIPSLKEWMSYNVDTLITLRYEKPKYKAIITKSLIGCHELDVTGKSLYDELLLLGV